MDFDCDYLYCDSLFLTRLPTLIVDLARIITCLFKFLLNETLSLSDSIVLSCLNRLGSHLSPSGTECYITSDMFYVEVQLDTSGQLVDVKVAHQGENPTVSLP